MFIFSYTFRYFVYLSPNISISCACIVFQLCIGFWKWGRFRFPLKKYKELIQTLVIENNVISSGAVSLPELKNISCENNIIKIPKNNLAKFIKKSILLFDESCK